jgi:hypothetical protein
MLLAQIWGVSRAGDTGHHGHSRARCGNGLDSGKAAKGLEPKGWSKAPDQNWDGERDGKECYQGKIGDHKPGQTNGLQLAVHSCMQAGFVEILTGMKRCLSLWVPG